MEPGIVGIERKEYLLLLLIPVFIYLVLYLLKRKVYPLSLLSILVEGENKLLKKLETILFYLIYILIVLFLSKPYILKEVNKENIVLIFDNSYTTGVRNNGHIRFTSLLTKLKNISKEIDKDSVYFTNYEMKKGKITDNLSPAQIQLNLTLVKSVIDANLKINNVVIFFTDAAGNKSKIVEEFKNHPNFYYYVETGEAKNYCIAKVKYFSEFLQKIKVIIYFENYGIDLPKLANINGKWKKIKNGKVKIVLPFGTKFIKVKLEKGDDSPVDNNAMLFLSNSNFTLVTKLEGKKNTFLTKLKKKIVSRTNKKILISDRLVEGNYHKIIYTGLSPTQKVKKVAFQNVAYFNPDLFKRIEKITFIKNEKIPQFMFLEGIPLLATNSGYLILEKNNIISTSFKTNENITLNKFWHIFLWKRIIEYSAKEYKFLKSKISLFSNCNLSSSPIKSKEFTKKAATTVYYLQYHLKIVLLLLLPVYLILFILLSFL